MTAVVFTTSTTKDDDDDSNQQTMRTRSNSTISKEDDNASLLSCDLIEQSKQHIAFLRALHRNGITLQRPSEESLRRYVNLWLPLVHSVKYDGFSADNATTSSSKDQSLSASSNNLIPPPDIAWLWHCHRLAPYRYEAYVQKTFFSSPNDNGGMQKHGFLDPNLPFTIQFKDHDNGVDNATLHDDNTLEDEEYTRRLWNATYPTESFFLLNSATKNKRGQTKQADNILLEGFDVLESCERQSAFLWQVSGVEFANDSFLEAGVANYCKFLRLMGSTRTSNDHNGRKVQVRPEFIVPTYQIDLMWHTHILSSIRNYHDDCMRINGCTLEHDDSLTDRTDGGILDRNFKATCSLWKDMYGVEYKVKGGMYRGEPPKQFYTSQWASLPTHIVSTMDPAIDRVLAHLIGEIGASSVSSAVTKATSDQGLSNIEWRSLNYSKDGMHTFLPAAPKSMMRGVNANVKKENYVFGKGPRGDGYYHIYTREAYELIGSRIQAEVNDKQAKVDCLLCAMFVLFPLLPIWYCCRQESVKELQELKDVLAVVKARKDAAGPMSELELPEEIKDRFKKRSTNNADSGGFVSGGGGCGYYASSAYMCDAGGCGGGGGYTGGAGCGGGACSGGGGYSIG